MAQVLSQDEVDALLNGIASSQEPGGNAGAAASGPAGEAALSQTGGGELKPYDFTRSEISTRGRLPGLEVILHSFARRLQSMFASELGKSVDAGLDGMEVVLYENLIQRLPLPASLHLVRLEPLRGIGALVIEARIAFAMIELFFGGNSQKTMKIEGRDFTPIENKFLGKFVEKMLVGMEESWQAVTQIKGRYLRTETNPYLLNAAGMGDPMIAATYSINMAPISGTILFALPLAAIEEVREHLKSAVPITDDMESIGIFKRAIEPLLEVEVETQAVVDVINMSLGEIMGLRPGDIIQLNGPGLDQVELWVEGKRKFLGKGAQRNGSKVFVNTRRS
jgi:flagellar motor switch protein FliM